MQVEDDGGLVTPTPMGRVASLYYLHHTTMARIQEQFRGRDLRLPQVLEVGAGGGAREGDLPPAAVAAAPGEERDDAGRAGTGRRGVCACGYGREGRLPRAPAHRF